MGDARSAVTLEIKALWRQKNAAQQRHRAAKEKVDAESSLATATATCPNEWTEHVDPQSGDVFYFNSTTGETSWTKPAPAMHVVATGVATAAAKTEEWTEHIDPQTSNIYYFNANTGESSWTKPALGEAGAAIKKDESPSTADEATAWTEHIDPDTGGAFYYNAATGMTSWTKPDISTPQRHTIARDWTEHIDQASGDKFYFNEATGETSWTLPEESSYETVGQALASGSCDDWTENIDPSSGNTFYYNVKTLESAWTKPSTCAAAHRFPLQALQHV